VTLCWRRNASPFWIMLLLISGPADHEWIGISFGQLAVGRACKFELSNPSLNAKCRMASKFLTIFQMDKRL
jgi:hypothetical protein